MNITIAALLLLLMTAAGCTTATQTREHEWQQVKAAFLYGMDVGQNKCEMRGKTAQTESVLSPDLKTPK